MGLFGSRSSAETTSQTYLISAPPGPRTEVLASACELQIAELPLAGRAAYGQPLTPAEIESATVVVRHNLRQDQDLSAWIARKVMQHLFVIMSDHMLAPTLEDRFAELFAAVGLRSAEQPDQNRMIELISQPPTLSGEDAAATIALANLSFAVYRARMLQAEAGGDYDFYVSLFTGEVDDAAELSYGIIAWEGVALGRLTNDGRARVSGLRTFSDEYKRVPAMTVPDWYPNPYKTGAIVSGEASLQRYWDGAAWTDQVRLRDGRGWKSLSASLHDRPTD